MTVVTQAISEKKLQKQPLVTSDVEAAGHTDALDSSQSAVPTNGNNLRPTALLVRVNRSRAKNLQNLTTTCVLLGAVFVFCAGLLASFYWYQEYARYRVSFHHCCCLLINSITTLPLCLFLVSCTHSHCVGISDASSPPINAKCLLIYHSCIYLAQLQRMVWNSVHRENVT